MVEFAQQASIQALRRRLAGLLPPRATLDEWQRFYQAWRRNPREIGAMAPSGRALARAITQPVPPGAGPVLELGSGTGVFTRALLARGVAERDLVLVEREPHFAQALRERFPAALVLEGDAAARHTQSVWAAVPQAPGAIVCGLPLLNMRPRRQWRVMQGAFSVLQPGGALLLFTYGVRCPVPLALLQRLGLQAHKLESVMANVPPAHVWRITRRG